MALMQQQLKTTDDQGGDIRHDYIRQSLAYVPAVARRYRGCGLQFDELVAAGNLGLVEAALRFDPGRGVKFITYADWWIRKSILEALELQNGPLKLPRYQSDRLRSLREARRAWVGRHGQNPDRDQLAQAAGLTRRNVDRLLPLLHGALSLDQSAQTGDEGNPLRDRLPDPSQENPQGSLVRRDLGRHLRRHVANLSPRERKLIALRFGFDGRRAMSLRETGLELGLSRERVRQLELRVLLQLKQAI